MEEQEFSGSFSLGVWKKFFRFLKPFKKRVITAVTLMGLGGMLDASYTLLQMHAVDRFIKTGSLEGVGLFIAGFACVIAVQTANTYYLIALANEIMIRVSFDLRREGFAHLQRLSMSYFDKTQVGWIVARITGDTYNLAGVLAWGLVDIVWSVAIMLFVSVYMLLLNWKLALIVLSVMPLLAVATLFFQKRILTHNREVRKNNSRMTGAINEGIMGAKTSKILATEDKNDEEFETVSSNLSRSTVRAAFYSALFLPVVMTIGSVGLALTLHFGGSGASPSGSALVGTLSLGTLSAFLTYASQIFEPLREIARIISNIISTQASAERIIALMESKSDVVDSPEVVEVFGDEYEPKKENWPALGGGIEFENVTHSYAGAPESEAVLSDFSLKIPKGQSVALVGETGAGKSTIVNLICRFYEPQKGRILIDGEDARTRSQLWLQSNIGYVLQDPHLFSGTIRENIRYGRLEASDQDVEDAARSANVLDAIKALPDGFDTQVGEGGGRLSQGEKQLISIARAVIADPAIFILDEATSSVDTQTEKDIQNAIESLMRGRTSIIIAHRLSTVKSVDRIILIENGAIVEDGNHSGLLALKGRYYDLCRNQFIRSDGE